MMPIVVITLTGLILIATLLRAALALPPDETTMRSGRHPLILLLGSLLSLMALFSIVRELPVATASGWPVTFHVGFICLWLLLMSRRDDPLSRAGTSDDEEA